MSDRENLDAAMQMWASWRRQKPRRGKVYRSSAYDSRLGRNRFRMSKEYFVQTEESKWAVDLTGEVIERAALKA